MSGSERGRGLLLLPSPSVGSWATEETGVQLRDQKVKLMK